MGVRTQAWGQQGGWEPPGGLGWCSTGWQLFHKTPSQLARQRVLRAPHPRPFGPELGKAREEAGEEVRK